MSPRHSTRMRRPATGSRAIDPLTSDERIAQLRREVNGARNHASHWRREVAGLVGVQAEGRTDSDLLRRLVDLIASGEQARALQVAAEAEEEAARDAVGQVAAALGLDGAPTRWNLERVVERAHELNGRET